MLFSREFIAFLAVASLGGVMAAPVPVAEASPKAEAAPADCKICLSF